MAEASENSSALPDLIHTGTDTAGAAIGAVVGSLLGGPGGAVAGASVGPPVSHALRKIGIEVKNRYLSHREDKRVASVIYFAVDRMQEKMDRGETPRNDGFFDEVKDNRSEADEIVEGALITVQREHEEQKIKYIGNLLANICFDSSIGGSEANVLIRVAERMSWRQLRILSYLNRLQEFSIHLGTQEGIDPDQVQAFEPAPDDLLHEVTEIQRMRVLMDLSAFMGFPLDPSKYVVSELGKRLYSLMELSKINRSEIQELEELCKFGRYKP
jgi:hypothetical protein